jgi:hypothetical protein
MPRWQEYLIAITAILVIAPLIAVLATRFGRGARGNLGLAMILLGFGRMLDPPTRHVIEANEKVKRPSPETGEPPLPSDEEDASTQA